MAGFDKSLRLKGKAEEDRYFAKLDGERVLALHLKNIEALSDKHSLEATSRSHDCRDKLADHSAAVDKNLEATPQR